MNAFIEKNDKAKKQGKIFVIYELWTEICVSNDKLSKNVAILQKRRNESFCKTKRSNSEKKEVPESRRNLFQ